MLLGIAAAICVTTVIIEAVKPGRLWVGLVPVTLVAFVLAGRWPTVIIPGPLNPDESLMLAQAIKFDTDLLPWRSIDPGTGGPVNSYMLLALHWLGMPIGYPMARVAALFCIGAMITLCWLAMSRIGGRHSAAIALLPAAAFFALGTDVDFVHYSSELASLATTALLVFLVSRLPLDRSIPVPLCVGIGVCAFIVSMSKVQGLPLAAALGASVLALTSTDIRIFFLRAVLVVASASACFMLILSILALAGVLDDFHASFVSLPFQYASTPLDFPGMKSLIRAKPESLEFAKAWTALLVVAAFTFPLHAAVMREPLKAIQRLAASGLVLVGMYLTLTRPGKIFPHYTAYLGLALPWIVVFLLPWARNIGRPGQKEGAVQ